MAFLTFLKASRQAAPEARPRFEACLEYGLPTSQGCIKFLLDPVHASSTLGSMTNHKRTDDPLPPAAIERKMYLLRRQKMMLDSDLAALYGIESKQLNRAVRRNLERFPSDFMFRLTPAEVRALRFQIGTSSEDAHGGRRYLPYVFTQEGVAMLSSL